MNTTQPPTIVDGVSVHLIGPAEAQLHAIIEENRNLDSVNGALKSLTGIRSFFDDAHDMENARRFLAVAAANSVAPTIREWGDFQTPPSLVARVCQLLFENGVRPHTIIEPTYGEGNFILTALDQFPACSLIYGVEIQPRYAWTLKLRLLTQALQGWRPSAAIDLHHDDIFRHRFSNEVLQSDSILLLGNPPWVTNAELGSLQSQNLPNKRNLKTLNGLDALTGKSNFDLNEWIVLHLLEKFAGRCGTLAMLCKNSVIKNLVHDLPQTGFGVRDIQALEIDALTEFGASVAASLLVMQLGDGLKATQCRVAHLDGQIKNNRTFGWSGHNFVCNVEAYEKQADLEGCSPLVWRQGLKHDCAAVMELEERDGQLFNARAERVDIESEWVYDFLKSSDLRVFQNLQPRKKIIVTQRDLRQSPSILKLQAPRLWEYLTRHADALSARKSSIYRGKPEFSIFGIGDYTFKPYKVGISGLYKKPNFCLVVPINGRPVLMDDTCYFLGFDNVLDALFTTAILNSPIVSEFLLSIAFTDAKRPFTKDVLMRIDLSRAAARLSFDDVKNICESTSMATGDISERSYEDFKARLLAPASRKSTQSELPL